MNGFQTQNLLYLYRFNQYFLKIIGIFIHRNVKIYSTSLIKTTMRYYFIPVRRTILKKQRINSVGEYEKKREPPHSAGGNVNWYNYGKQHEMPQKLWTELPYDLAVPLLSIYLKNVKTLTRKDTHIPMVIVPLFLIAKIWKPPNSPSSDEWIKSLLSIC